MFANACSRIIQLTNHISWAASCCEPGACDQQTVLFVYISVLLIPTSAVKISPTRNSVRQNLWKNLWVVNILSQDTSFGLIIACTLHIAVDYVDWHLLYSWLLYLYFIYDCFALTGMRTHFAGKHFGFYRFVTFLRTLSIKQLIAKNIMEHMET